jgi:hypothetical protein
VHAARRRVFLLVWVAVRLLQRLKRKRRMCRVHSFSYYIPFVLQQDSKRFVVSL